MKKNVLIILTLLLNLNAHSQMLSPKQDTLLKYLNKNRRESCSFCEIVYLEQFKKSDFNHPIIEKRMLEIVKNEWNKEDLKRVDNIIDEDINVRLKRHFIENANESFEEENKVLDYIKWELYIAPLNDPIRKKPFTILNNFKNKIDSIFLRSMYSLSKSQIDSVKKDTFNRKKRIYNNDVRSFKKEQRERLTWSQTPSEFYFYYAWLKGKESIPLFLQISKDSNVMKLHKEKIEIILAKLEVEPYKTKILNKYSFNNKINDSFVNFECFLNVLKYLNTQESYYHMKGLFLNKNTTYGFFPLKIKLYYFYICTSYELFRLFPNVLKNDTMILDKLKKMDSLCDRIDNIYTEEDYFDFGQKVANWIETNKGKFVRRKEDEIVMPYCNGRIVD